MSLNDKKQRLNLVGGQAVIEGVMMKCKNHCALAMRKEDGTIITEEFDVSPLRERLPVLGWPVIRGFINFIESMQLSMKTLSKSADAFGLEEEPSRLEVWLEQRLGNSMINIIMAAASVLAVALAVGLFMLLPTWLTRLADSAVGGLGWARNLVEGLIKIAIFLAYMWAVSLIKDIRRTFEYHGAEHKSIYCFEAGQMLTPENVQQHSRFHPRCGTSFIFVILIISIAVFSLPFVTWEIIWLRVVTKLLLLPLIVGLGFEFLMYAGKNDNLLVRICSAPGLWVQRLTTKEPDLQQLEIAIAALKLAVPQEYAYLFPAEDQPADHKAADAPAPADQAAADPCGTGNNKSTTISAACIITPAAE